jgi:hypothetical protein
MLNGFKLTFTKVDAETIQIENIHSERANYFSSALVASPSPYPTCATRYFLDLSWKYLGCLNRRIGYKNANIETELKLILQALNGDDLSFICDMPVGASISTKLLSGSKPTSNSELSLDHHPLHLKCT